MKESDLKITTVKSAKSSAYTRPALDFVPLGDDVVRTSGGEGGYGVKWDWGIGDEWGD